MGRNNPCVCVYIYASAPRCVPEQLVIMYTPYVATFFISNENRPMCLDMRSIDTRYVPFYLCSHPGVKPHRNPATLPGNESLSAKEKWQSICLDRYSEMGKLKITFDGCAEKYSPETVKLPSRISFTIHIPHLRVQRIQLNVSLVNLSLWQPCRIVSLKFQRFGRLPKHLHSPRVSITL